MELKELLSLVMWQGGLPPTKRVKKITGMVDRGQFKSRFLLFTTHDTINSRVVCTAS